jgi:hypothetical protein
MCVPELLALNAQIRDEDTEHQRGASFTRWCVR